MTKRKNVYGLKNKRGASVQTFNALDKMHGAISVSNLEHIKFEGLSVFSNPF